MISRIFSLLVRKIIEIILSIGFLVTFTFLLLKYLPGGPFDDEKVLNPSVKEKMIQHWAIDKSLSSQVFSYLQGLSRGDLGVSLIRPEREVADIILVGFKNTFFLNSLGLGFIVLGALIIAFFSVYYSRTWIETLLEQLTLTLLSLPSLFWGPLLIYIFGFYFNFLPTALLTSPLHYILPLLTLCSRPTATLARILKNSIQENLHQDYVRTARAKGAGDFHILFHHVMRNSLVPFLSYGGPLLVSIFSGSFLVEVLFAVPGLGSEFVSAIQDRDYTLITGLTLFYGVLLVLTNTAIDLILRWVDPRLRDNP